MKKIIYWLGCFLITIIFLSIPALTAISFVCKWNSTIQFILTIINIIEVFGITDMIVEGDINE